MNAAPEILKFAGAVTGDPQLAGIGQAAGQSLPIIAKAMNSVLGTAVSRPIGQDETVELNGQQVSTFFTYIRYTDPGSNAGIPGLQVPVDLTRDGLPVGLELDGPAGSDRALLAIGLAVEEEFRVAPRPYAVITDVLLVNTPIVLERTV